MSMMIIVGTMNPYVMKIHIIMNTHNVLEEQEAKFIKRSPKYCAVAVFLSLLLKPAFLAHYHAVWANMQQQTGARAAE